MLLVQWGCSSTSARIEWVGPRRTRSRFDQWSVLSILCVHVGVSFFVPCSFRCVCYSICQTLSVKECKYITCITNVESEILRKRSIKTPCHCHWQTSLHPSPLQWFSDVLGPCISSGTHPNTMQPMQPRLPGQSTQFQCNNGQLFGAPPTCITGWLVVICYMHKVHINLFILFILFAFVQGWAPLWNLSRAIVKAKGLTDLGWAQRNRAAQRICTSNLLCDWQTTLPAVFVLNNVLDQWPVDMIE